MYPFLETFSMGSGFKILFHICITIYVSAPGPFSLQEPFLKQKSTPASPCLKFFPGSLRPGGECEVCSWLPADLPSHLDQSFPALLLR